MTTSTAGHLRHETLVGGLSNAIFNGLVAWLLLRGGSALSWGGEHSFVVDILATAFLLPMIVALIVIPLQRRKLQRGELPVMDLGSASALQRLANRFPDEVLPSALLFGLLGLSTIAPLTLLGLRLAGIAEFAPVHYAVFKGLWAGLVAALMVLPMVLCALREPAGPQRMRTARLLK